MHQKLRAVTKHLKKLYNKETSEYKFPVELFSEIPSNSIDYAVMEKEKIFLYPFLN